MDNIRRLAKKIQHTGFQCTMCGQCCRAVEKDSNLVMITPPEIHAIGDAFGFSWLDVAEPYPEKIVDGRGRVFMIGWCIRREKDHCRFLEKDTCTVYSKRPWICITYPFSLYNGKIRTSPCPGLGREISWKDALSIARDLVNRSVAESNDEDQIRLVLKNVPATAGEFTIIDSEGMKRLSGE